MKTKANLPFSEKFSSFKYLEDILCKDENLAGTMADVLNAPLSKSTIKSYEYVWRDFSSFCIKHFYSIENISEQSVIHFLFKLEHNKVGAAYFQKVIPAIRLRCKLTGRTVESLESPYLNTVIQGCKRLAVKRKAEVKKAKAFPLTVLKCLVGRYIAPFLLDSARIDAEAFCSIFRAIIQYFTFCRFDCFSKLQARHFSIKGESIEVYFPSAKNDQFHQGKTTFLMPNNTVFCPVQLTKLYFIRFGLNMGEKTDLSFVNFRLKKCGKNSIPVLSESVSYNTAVKCTRSLLTKNGFNAKDISEKSAKMEGVTQSLKAGATVEELMWLGRWRTQSIPYHYKVNSEKFKQSLASKVPF